MERDKGFVHVVAIAYRSDITTHAPDFLFSRIAADEFSCVFSISVAERDRSS